MAYSTGGSPVDLFNCRHIHYLVVAETGELFVLKIELTAHVEQPERTARWHFAQRFFCVSLSPLLAVNIHEGRTLARRSIVTAVSTRRTRKDNPGLTSVRKYVRVFSPSGVS